MRGRAAVILTIVVLLIFPTVPAAVAVTSAVSSGGLHGPIEGPRILPGSSAFAFVANFEDHHLDGWSATQGTSQVVSSPNYRGEPSLQSTASGGVPQVDEATQGFVTGSPSLSFQAAVHPGKGTAWVGIAAGTSPVAVVGLSGGTVWAGTDSSSAAAVGTVPSGTAQPAGWVWVSANVYTVTSGKSVAWVMDVYVDRTDVPVATGVSVPSAGGYTGAWIATAQGTAEYTNFVYTSYEIPTTIPGYNNMDGYGQGSGLLASILPAFTTLTARMVLSDWNTPQAGILSFQINAMNYKGTTRSTCGGFFQLGVDLDPNGTIAPWYVPGVNCVAHYFTHSNSPAISGGFASPPGSVLRLMIADQVGQHSILFSIIDTSVSGANRTWIATIPYSGGEFFGTYTQIEWQPCCSNFPIGSYYLNGTLNRMDISGGSLASATPLGSAYMLPFALDTPPSWSMNYYSDATSGYRQVG